MDDKEYGKIKKLINKGKYPLSEDEAKQYKSLQKTINQNMKELKKLDKDFFEKITKDRIDKERELKQNTYKAKYQSEAGRLIFKHSGQKFLDDQFIRELNWVLLNRKNIKEELIDGFKHVPDKVKNRKEKDPSENKNVTSSSPASEEGT